MEESSAIGGQCDVRRVGLVLETDEYGLTARINGKHLRIAKAKAEEGISAGQFIVWNGSSWMASNEHYSGTS